jgi:long-chain acyl-CoA synthetase
MPSFKTIPETFLHRISSTPDRAAFMYPSGSGWATLTWKQTGERVRAIAQGLRALGLANEQRCAILSGTRIEWVLIDMGILCGGGATTTIYPSNTPEDCAYILKDSNSSFCFAENEDQVKKLRAKQADLPGLKKVIVVDGAASSDGWVLTLADLEKKGEEESKAKPSEWEEIARAVKGESLATLIYTSGTTGMPKGVELTHDCWVFEGEGIEALDIIHIDDVQYFWLPLAHSFGKVLEAAQIRIGFVTAIDGRIDKLVGNLAAIKPTFVCAVPRIFEKVYAKVQAGAAEGGGLKKKIFDWAVGVGKADSRKRQAGQTGGGLGYSLATKLVFSKLHALFGGRLRFFISGSAPLSREVAEFFDGAKVLILEGYGLTETSAGTYVNRPNKHRIGTVGVPFPGVEVKIAPEDGEILLKGRGVMRGYHGLVEATKEALTADGWLRTGDIGEIDKDGFLKITDRKKDLIKTSGGKYVAPQALEGKLKALCPYVSQVLVHGNNRNFVSALVAVEEEAIKKWATEHGINGRSYGDLAADPKVKELIEGHVKAMNRDLASYESIKKIAILPKDLTEADGDLTPSLKLKRKAVEKKYASILDGFYVGGKE